jgi:thymidylate synthase ThyX
MYRTKILLDSIAPCGKRLTTWELEYPRIVHAELMTHRLFSRNSASSRAIPVKKMLDKIMNDPVLPKWWGKNQPGMSAREELDLAEQEKAIKVWLKGRDQAVAIAEELLALNVHKQIANRVTEPWMFITVILSSTEFDNWDKLRDHPDAQPEIAWLAGDMIRERNKSTPVRLAEGDWHMPLLTEEDIEFAYQHQYDSFIEGQGMSVDGFLKKISVGRCARVSYLTHDGKRDYNEDIKLHDKLISSEPLHMSPFEHVAQALAEPKWIGNFIGFKQYRKEFEKEHVGGSLERLYSK